VIANANNTELVEALYVNRTYRIDGQVSRPDGQTGGLGRAFEIMDASRSISMPFITTVRAGVLGIGEKMQSRYSVNCNSAPAQFQRFANLRNADYATVIGKVTGFDGGTLQLDCRFEK